MNEHTRFYEICVYYLIYVINILTYNIIFIINIYNYKIYIYIIIYIYNIIYTQQQQLKPFFLYWLCINLIFEKIQFYYYYHNTLYVNPL